MSPHTFLALFSDVRPPLEVQVIHDPSTLVQVKHKPTQGRPDLSTPSDLLQVRQPTNLTTSPITLERKHNPSHRTFSLSH